MSAPRSQRLLRLLNLVPYFQANEGISLAEAAAEIGVSKEDLTKDLDLLWMCGLPGHVGGDLIDLSVSENSVQVAFSAGIDRPLRLTSLEAMSLVLALRMLVDQPSSIEPTAALSAIAKIEQASGTASATPAPPASSDSALDPIVETIRSAVHNRRALRLQYYSASRDAQTDRVVDPVLVRLVDGHSYLEAWCRQSEGLRMFRFDRIDAAQELPEDAVSHAAAVSTERGAGGIFEAGAELPEVRLRIAPELAWVLEYYPLEVDSELPGGGVEATMRYASEEWLLRLLLGFGAQISVLDNPALATKLRAAADAARAAYRKSL